VCKTLYPGLHCFLTSTGAANNVFGVSFDVLQSEYMLKNTSVLYVKILPLPMPKV